MSIYLSVYLQDWKRSYSVRLPQFLNLTTSKTKLQKWKVEGRADGLVPMRFAIFPLHLSKLLRLPRKSGARSYEVLHLSRKIISANLKIWCSKMQPLSGNQRLDLLTALMNMSLVLRLPRKMHLCRSSSNVPTPAIVFGNATKPSRFAHFCPVRLPRETTSERPKVVRTWCVLYIVTSKYASRHNGVHFFDISPSEGALNPSVVYAFDFEMCFAPQRRALFRHLNFQKWSGPGVFCTFWLRNVLRATTLCTFSSLIWPAGSAPAALASLLFDPPEPQIIGKTQCFATFLPFRASASSFFWDFLFLIFFLLLFSSLTLPISAFHLSILSEVWLLNFLRSIFIYIWSSLLIILLATVFLIVIYCVIFNCYYLLILILIFIIFNYLFFSIKLLLVVV